MTPGQIELPDGKLTNIDYRRRVAGVCAGEIIYEFSSNPSYTTFDAICMPFGWNGLRYEGGVMGVRATLENLKRFKLLIK